MEEDLLLKELSNAKQLLASANEEISMLRVKVLNLQMLVQESLVMTKNILDLVEPK
jgi:hypothetical protein